MDLTAETTLKNRQYILHKQLGQGVLTRTYQATNAESGQTVIIRTPAPNLHQHENFHRFKPQFLELAQRLKTCQHPHLVKVLDSFEEGGCPYMVLEYIPGQTLAQILQSKSLSGAKILLYTYQIANALKALHQSGLLHQDVKPQNIIRRQDTGYVVLAEFGMFSELLPGMIQTQTNLLSPGYAPIEQYSFPIQYTPASDIYSLAATLHCLLYKTPPLPALVRQTLLNQGCSHLLLPKLPRVAPKIHSAIQKAIEYGLELTPQNRPQTIEAWLALLPQPRQKPAPQPSLDQYLANQPKVNANTVSLPHVAQTQGQTTAVNGKSPLAPTTEPLPTQNSATKIQELQTFSPPISTKLQKIPPFAAKLLGTSIENPSAKPNMQSVGYKLVQWRKSPLKALLMTSAIAASVGLGFGIALRINSPKASGSTIFHMEQSFPPKRDWPVSKPHL
jgi:serine/threonine-protein kinase